MNVKIEMGKNKPKFMYFSWVKYVQSLQNHEFLSLVPIKF